MARRRLGVIVTLPEPLAVHVQAWRRALRDPTAERVGPHLTLVPPQAVPEEEVPAAVALVERAAAEAVPAAIELDGAATFLPASLLTLCVSSVILRKWRSCITRRATWPHASQRSRSWMTTTARFTTT